MIIALLLLLALILRLVLLNQSFWLDEAISVLTAAKPFPYQWTDIYGDFQPPLYYLILRMYMFIPFWSEWFLRLPSVLFGVATVGIIYYYARGRFDQKIAVVSSFLLAISQFHVYYSQELRMYSLLCMLSLLSMWLSAGKKWSLLLLVSILGIYTNYMFLLTFFPQLIWLIYKHWHDWVTWRKWIFTLAGIFLAFVPWLPNFSKQLVTGHNLATALPVWRNLSSPPFWKLVPQVFLKFTLGRISLDDKNIYGLIFCLLLVFFGYIFWNLKKTWDDRVIYLINWLISPLIAGIIISFFIPIAGAWRLIFLLPPFLLLTSVSLANLKHFRFTLFIFAVVGIGSNFAYWFMPKFQREQWRGAVAFLESSDDPVIFVTENGFAPYQWYRRENKQVCGQLTFSQCLSKEGVYYVSYLEDLFDQKKTIEGKIKTSGYRQDQKVDFPGVGFVYHYESSY